MAFTFECNCGWNSGVNSGGDFGPNQKSTTCSKCGNVELDGPTYKFTTEEVLDGQIPCRAGCGSIAFLRTLRRDDEPRNAQVSDWEVERVAVHPVTGEKVYCFTQPGQPMPEEYRKEGFQEVAFRHYKDLERFCRENGQVNDIEGDYHKDDGGYWGEDYRKREKEYAQQQERYMEERELAVKAGVLPRR